MSVRNKPNETKFVLIIKALKIFLNNKFADFKGMKVRLFEKEKGDIEKT